MLTVRAIEEINEWVKREFDDDQEKAPDQSDRG